MKALTTIRVFTDAREGVLREVGATFTADDERAEQLRILGFVRVEDIPEKPKTKRKRKE